MNLGILIRILFCVACVGGFLYTYIHKQNTITELRMQIPLLAKSVELIEQENIRLQFEIDQFENPAHLMELLRLPEYRHLKHPLVKEIVTIVEE